MGFRFLPPPGAWFFLFFLFQGCYTLGPSYETIPATGPVPFTGRYVFSPQVRFFSGGSVGEVVTWRDRVRPDLVYFSMKTAGIQRNGSYRLKSYEGEVVRINNRLEFRSNRCFEFGKKSSDDRLEVIDAWDCDHLIFQFTGPDDFKTNSPLTSIRTSRTTRSSWFGRIVLYPVPSPAGKKARDKRATFTGQILQEKPNHEVVVYGTDGARILEDNQILGVEDGDGNRVGKLKVLYRPGDFIHCQWMERPEGDRAIQGLVVFALKGKKKIDLFD